MTDAFEVTGAFAPAENSTDNTSFASDAVHTADTSIAMDTPEMADVQAVPEVPEAPNGFVLLGLAPELVAAVKDLGYTQPTTVQLKTIPLALPTDGADQQAKKYIDLMVSSQTGSGKTAAFLLPVLHTLLKQLAQAEIDERAAFEREVAEATARGEAAPKRPKRKDPTNTRNFKAPAPGALIVCPTRELAQQVANDAIDLVQHCRGLRIANIVGGMPYQLQIAKLQNANLVVATPGRLLDLQRSMQIKLDQVQFLVVDEADRMLDLGFSDDLAEINQLTIGRKQTMMFSATFAPRIQQLAARVMREPQRITIDSPTEKHSNIKQVLFWADNAQHKRKLLDHWLRDTTINQAIVFASTQIECDGLANDLQQDGFDAVALHGALSQGLRNRRLMALRNGQVQILVATDVAARGIDVPTITHVFNFGLPMKAEDYTHRIGRTGRAATAARFSTSKPTHASPSRLKRFLVWSHSNVLLSHVPALLAVPTPVVASVVIASSTTAPAKVALVATAATLVAMAVVTAVVTAAVVSVDAHLPAALVILVTAHVISVVLLKKASATNAREVSTTALPAKALPAVMYVPHVVTSSPAVTSNSSPVVTFKPHAATLMLPVVTSVAVLRAAISLPASQHSASRWA
jgi:superfamily II DNA/RNA helicase